MIEQLGVQQEVIMRSVMDIIYYMRGGVTYEEAMYMSVAERDIAIDYINDKLKEEAKIRRASMGIYDAK